MLRALGMDGEDVAALEPLAKKGAPTIPTLQAAFPSVADAILAATSAIGPDAGFLDRVAAFGSSLVSIRPTSPIEGDTPEAIVSRMQDAVHRDRFRDRIGRARQAAARGPERVRDVGRRCRRPGRDRRDRRAACTVRNSPGELKPA